MNWNDIFRYENGHLYWKNTGKRRILSKPSGCKRKNGYIVVRLNKKLYCTHRIIWEMFNGKIPDGIEIDHIDRNPSNNKIENLRLATRQENNRNTSANGFCWNDRDKIFRAYIKIDGRQKFLGNYKNMIDARASYLRSRREHFGEFA